MRTVVMPLSVAPDDAASLFARPIDEVTAESRLAGGDVTIDSVALFIKPPRLRAEGQSATVAGYAVFDYESGLFRLVNPVERAYVEWTVEEFKQLVQGDSGPAPETPPEQPAPDARSLGVTRTINGMECRGYEIRTANAIAHVWVTAAHPDLVTTFARYVEQARNLRLLGEDAVPDPEALVFEYGFPVLVQTLVLTEASYKVSETVAIERQALPDGLFEAPPGYSRLTLRDLIRPDR